MLINLNCDLKSITLDRKAQKKVICSQIEEKNERRKNLDIGRHGDWQNSFSPLILFVLFVCLFYFWGLKFELIT
jgi:hypothetical protein